MARRARCAGAQPDPRADARVNRTTRHLSRTDAEFRKIWVNFGDLAKGVNPYRALPDDVTE
jgi:hypothetical protein